MKKIFLYLGLFFLIQTLYSQEFSFPLFFEDALGNKDTLYFGFDENATSGIDEELGEVNLIKQGVNTTLFSFFTDGATYDEIDDLHNVKTPTYILKHQYNNIHEGFYFEIGIINENWPIKISWNKQGIVESNIVEYSGNKNFQLLMTNFHSPGGWFDFLKCWHPCPCEHLPMTDTNTVSIGLEQLCSYRVDFNDNNVYLLYIGYVDKTLPVNNVSIDKLRYWYDDKTESVYLENLRNLESCKIQLYDLGGKLLITNNCTDTTNPLIKISQLNDGVFIIRIIDNTQAIFYPSIKIIKL